MKNPKKPTQHTKAKTLLKGYFDALIKENKRRKRKTKLSLNSGKQKDIIR